MDFGNLISLSSAFSKSSLNIWKFLVHILLKLSLKDWALPCWHVKWVQLYSNVKILWHWPSLEWKLIFSSPVATTEFSRFDGILSTASSFRIWNTSTGISSPPLALFIVMLPKAHLTSHSRKSGSSWVITPLWYLGHEDLLCIVFCVFLPPLLNIFCFC